MDNNYLPVHRSNLMDTIIFLMINDYIWSCFTNILQVFHDWASHWANLQRKLIVLICLHLGQLSSFWAREWTSKIMTTFYALFLLCCLLFLGQCGVSMSQKKYGAYAPSTTKLSRGICPRLTANESFFHFGQLFNASCSPLTKILICSSLFPLNLPSGVVLPCCDVYIPFKHPATTLFCCVVLNGLNFWTAISCLHVNIYVYHHYHQNHCFQFHLPLQYGSHLCLLLLPLLLGIIVLLYWACCFLLYLDFTLKIYFVVNNLLLVKNTAYILTKILFPFSHH